MCLKSRLTAGKGGLANIISFSLFFQFFIVPLRNSFYTFRYSLLNSSYSSYCYY